MTLQWTPVAHLATWETYTFSHVGALAVQTGRSRFPVAGGTFILHSVAVSLGTPPAGGPVVVDVLVNGVSVYADPADRPTVTEGEQDVVSTAHAPTTLTTGDHVSVDIAAVGSVAPGQDLVVVARVQKGQSP